jgi:hypothetical protein
MFMSRKNYENSVAQNAGGFTGPDDLEEWEGLPGLKAVPAGVALVVVPRHSGFLANASC